MTEQPNVFVLSLDSLRRSSFKSQTHRIADLIGGVDFTNAVAPASHTTSSMPPLTTGTFADEFSTWGLPTTGDPKPAAERFSENGYTCGLWTDNYLFGAEYNYDRGFTAGNRGRPTTRKRIANYVKDSPLRPLFGVLEWTYFNVYHRLRSRISPDESFYRSAADLNDQLLRWIDSHPGERPLFCWVHYMDNHHPYEPPGEYLKRQPFRGDWTRGVLGEFTRNAIKSNGTNLSEDQLYDLNCAYEATCEYAGDQVITLIEELIDRGEYDPESDVMVVTADHGECLELEPYGMLGHVPPAFWEDIVNVPLVVGRPDWEPGCVSRQVSLIDLLPTILTPIDGGLQSEREIATTTDLHRDTVRLVSQWEHQDSGEIRTYRGVRREDGTKCFGGFRHGEDQVIYARVTDGIEEILDSWSWDHFSPQDIPPECSNLHQILLENGGAVEHESSESRGRDIDREHLKNLGYLE